MRDTEAEIRRLARAELDRTGLLLGPAEFASIHAAVARHGMAAWRRLCAVEPGHRDAPAALGLDVSTITRVLGFGYVQTSTMADALGSTARDEVPATGALLNLGVSLFDWIADRHPERAAIVRGTIAPDDLGHLMAGAPLPRQGEPGVDLLLAVVGAFFREVGAMTASRAVAAELLGTLREMQLAELTATAATRDAAPLDAALWRALEAKSVFPMRAMALVSVLADKRPPLAPARDLGTAIGAVMWRVDDLIDAGEDWDAGVWSRPWLLHANCCRGALAATASRDDALACLVADDVPRREAADLAAEMHAVRRLTPSRALDTCLRATVQSWIAG